MLSVAPDSQLLFREAEAHPQQGKLVGQRSLGSEVLWESSLIVTPSCAGRAKRKDASGRGQNFYDEGNNQLDV